MRFNLHIKIDSSNQDVVDFPKDTALKAINRAYKETQLMNFAPGSDNAVHATISDANGNSIGFANIEVVGEEDA